MATQELVVLQQEDLDIKHRRSRAEKNDLKYNFMKMMETLKEEIKDP